MYKTANVEYAKKLYGESVVERAIKYIESGKSPKAIETKREVFKVKALLEAMEKYEYAWWLSKDNKVIVSHQLKENVIMISAKKLISAVNEVFGTNFETVSQFIAKLPQLKKMSERIKV